MDGSKHQPASGMMAFMGTHGSALKQLVGHRLTLHGEDTSWEDQLASLILEEMCAGQITPLMTLASMTLAQKARGSVSNTVSIDSLFSVVKLYPDTIDALAASLPSMSAGNPVDLFAESVMKAWRLEDKGESYEALITSIRAALLVLGSGPIAAQPPAPAQTSAGPVAAAADVVPSPAATVSSSNELRVAAEAPKAIVALEDGSDRYLKLFNQWQTPAPSRVKQDERLAFVDSQLKGGKLTPAEAGNLKQLTNSQTVA